MSGNNKRGKSYPSPFTKEKEKEEQSRKDRYKRKKCRDTNPPPETCKNCSMADDCAIEGSQDWLRSKREPDEQSQDSDLNDCVKH